MSKLSLKIPPLVQGVIAILLIWLFDYYMPIYSVDIIFQGVVALIMICMGGLIGVFGVIEFIKMRTTVDPRYPKKASRLVVSGMYKYSRNPMYLGILLVLLGTSVYLGSISSFIVTFAFVMYINKYQISPEEQSLTQKFGENYKQYLQQVGRWF